jgi:hypothetical protein
MELDSVKLKNSIFMAILIVIGQYWWYEKHLRLLFQFWFWIVFMVFKEARNPSSTYNINKIYSCCYYCKPNTLDQETYVDLHLEQ